MIDRKPAFIARPTGTADVISAVNYARENEVLVSVKGGGHNVAGNAVCDDGLMIDRKAMQTAVLPSDWRRNPGIWPSEQRVSPASSTNRLRQ